MKMYLVRVFEPTVYEIEAEDEEQAAKIAKEMYKKRHKTWLEPEVQIEKK